MIWKPGDRAVICYRPQSDFPYYVTWLDIGLSRVGQIGTIKSAPYQDTFDILSRVHFQSDCGDASTPLTMILAPIIQDPFATIPKGEALHV